MRRWACLVAVVVLAAWGPALGGGQPRPQAAAPASTDVPAGLRTLVQRAAGGLDPTFRVGRRDGVLVASGGGVSSAFARSGVRASAAGGTVELRLSAVGYGRRLTTVASVEPVAAGNVVRFRRSGILEWYRNGPLGLEQGFALASRLGRGAGPLTLALSAGGSLHPRPAGAGVAFASPAGTVRLRYGGLSVLDALGRTVPASLSVSGARVLVRVWDRAARYPLRIDPFLQQGPKLTAIGEAGNGNFGISVALSAKGDTALIGASGDSGNVGAAWVFGRSGSTWRQQSRKLTSGAIESTGAFGLRVALSADGNTALVGGPLDDNGIGGAWVFTRSGTTWGPQGRKLTPTREAGRSSFGESVALSASGTTALIGGPTDANGAGAAWVFVRSGARWRQVEKLTGSDELGPARFGVSAALSSSGKTALVGGPLDDNGLGSAWVFARSGSGWSQQGKGLKPKGYRGQAQFGSSVALSAAGTTALIGAPVDNDDAGAAWVFTGSGSSWSQQGNKLTPNGRPGLVQFGDSVALSSAGGTALIGGAGNNGAVGQGAAWVFKRDGSGWAQYGRMLTGRNTVGNAGFGISVALSARGTTALIGGFNDSRGVGAAWGYHLW